jgi:hypothetical protein
MKTYYGLPKWFARQLKGTGNGSLCNAAECTHYIGTGFDAKKKTWTDGTFLTDFERCLPYWKQRAEKADFIVRFRGKE